MNDYVRNGIEILNDTTKELKKLDELGIYLAKQTDVNALKTLKLLILASQNLRLEKDFDIKHIKTYPEIILGEKRIINETVIGNLSMNPQNIGLELMEYILHNFQIDLSVEPCSSGYTIFDFWMRSFVRIENDQDVFYKRYDMIDKKLEILSFMLKKRILNTNQIDFLLTIFERCIQRKLGYSKEQLLKMQEIFNQIKLNEKLIFEINRLAARKKIVINCNKEELFDDLFMPKMQDDGCFTKNDAWDELLNYQMLNDQCTYMLNTIPMLVKEQIIK